MEPPFSPCIFLFWKKWVELHLYSLVSLSQMKFSCRASSLSDINFLLFERSHDFLAAGDSKARATESARTVKARSNVGSKKI